MQTKRGERGEERERERENFKNPTEISPMDCLVCTGCLQMNGAVSKVNKKFISHLTRAKRTPSAAVTVQVSHALPAVRSLVLTARLGGWCVFSKPCTALHAAL